MNAKLGVNCGYPFESDPTELAVTGTTLIRTVYRRTNDYSWWLPELQRRGIACWFVGDGSPESLGTDESQWGHNMAQAEADWGSIVKIWQWMNEPDWYGPASWPMSQEQVNRGLVTARSVFPRSKGYTLIAPGLVSGDPGWPEHIRLDLVDGLDVHPYNKFVSTEAEEHELAYMLSTYRDWWNKPLWIGEFDSRTDNLPVYFKNFPGVDAAVTFCWTSGQTAGEGIHGMGIKENPWAMANFKAAAKQSSSPVEQHAGYVLGFRKWFDQEPDLLGEAVKNERNVAPGWQTQPTKHGVLSWVGGLGHAFVTHDGRVYRWDESWPESREVT